jgi:hypothetical protein
VDKGNLRTDIIQILNELPRIVAWQVLGLIYTVLLEDAGEFVGELGRRPIEIPKSLQRIGWGHGNSLHDSRPSSPAVYLYHLPQCIREVRVRIGIYG